MPVEPFSAIIGVGSDDDHQGKPEKIELEILIVRVAIVQPTITWSLGLSQTIDPSIPKLGSSKGGKACSNTFSSRPTNNGVAGVEISNHTKSIYESAYKISSLMAMSALPRSSI